MHQELRGDEWAQGKVGLLKLWPGNPRQWSWGQESVTAVQVSSWGHVSWQKLIKREEEALQREGGLEVRRRAIQITRNPSWIAQITQIALLLLLEREKGGDHKQSFSWEHFCSCCAVSIYFCCATNCLACNMSMWPRQGQLLKYKHLKGDMWSYMQQHVQVRWEVNGKYVQETHQLPGLTLQVV